MKFHFDPNLDYQQEAMEAVCSLFRGQETCRTEFTVVKGPDDAQMRMGFAESDLGIGNRLQLLNDDLLINVRDIQTRHGLKPSAEVKPGHYDFTVEMETGTGKTYVYLRSVFELNKRYGFTKFVIVVPSVAIKEGVYQSIRMMEEHFRSLYANVPCDYFIYDSAKLGQVRNFATSPNIQIMVVTVGAINKFGDEAEAAVEEADVALRGEKPKNVMYRPSEKTGGEKPIDLIRSTRPILIVDEPQSVDGGLDGKGKAAMQRMNPLCTLRWSATHQDKHHMIYRLDAVDAYQRKLVKQIEVAAATVEGGSNKAFVRLISVENRKGVIRAQIEFAGQTKTGIIRKKEWVQPEDKLSMVAGRAIYDDHSIGEIRVKSGDEFMELRVPGAEHYLKPGEAYGDVEPMAIQRQMIRRTIKEHFDKEIRLTPHGIKVLSLFFIDEVSHYRQYDADGNAVKGEYARIFEEEYRRLAKHPDYQRLFKEVDVQTPAEEVHNGYFSIDRKKVGGKTVEMMRDTRGNTAADEDTYNLIMRDKEKLLGFASKLRFIFSHSALREGWDNPNVFQICSLRDMRSERERRQSIGRGLRLCRNQEGERVFGFGVNTLTVIAPESFEDFAENLQKEIEQDTGIRFGIVENYAFAGVQKRDDEGRTMMLGEEQSKALWAHLKEKGYINAQGKVQDALRTALKENSLNLPVGFEEQRPQVAEILRKLSGKLEIKNADHRTTVRSRQAILDGDDFKALWDRIKHKTTYRVQFDAVKLVHDCTEALNKGPAINTTRLQWRKADIAIGRAGVEATEVDGAAMVTLDEGDIELPDVLTDLQDKTQLTRRSIASIVIDSGRLNDFKRNPQQFIEIAAEVISRTKRLALVDGIKYQKLGDEEYYAQELFDQEELTGYLKNILPVNKAVYEHIIYDSDIERTFAEQLEKNQDVKVYTKLPGWFKVPTPLGSYNPDWAVLILKDGVERLYFVVETKSSLYTDDLGGKEDGKVKCGEAHFTALAAGTKNPVKYIKATKLADVLAVV